MDAAKTGKFIADLRRELGLTQRELAEGLNVTDKAISRWETGKGLPDTALLKPLSELLGVSVGELLSGERYERGSERADDVIIDALGYSAKMLGKALEGLLIIFGLGFLFSPLFLAGRGGYWIIGLALLAVAWLHRRRRKTLHLSLWLVEPGLWLTLLGALALEIIPGGAVLVFAAGPTERIRRFYSYFSLTALGYAHVTPMLTGILTMAAVALCLLGRRRDSLRHRGFVCTVLAAVFDLMPLLLLGSHYMTGQSCVVFALLVLSAGFQALSNTRK